MPGRNGQYVRPQAPTTRTLAEHAYTVYAAQQALPQPLYTALSYPERLGWALGIHAAVHEALAGAGVSLPQDLGTWLVLLRQRVWHLIETQDYSLKRASQAAGVNRRTLSRWLAGEENITVATVRCLEAWVRRETGCR